MKRIFWVTVVFFALNVVVYAQQTKTSAEIKQDSQQLLNQSKTSSSQFETTQADLNARNKSNSDAATYARMNTEIARLESLINRGQTNVSNSLNSGKRVSPETLDGVQRLIEQHKAALADLEGFIAK